MVRNIIIALFAFILIALIVIWVISGGPRRVITETRESISSAIAPTEAGFRLPWQPVELFPSLDITELENLSLEDTGGAPEDASDVQDRLRELEAEYDRLRGETARGSLNPPSPYAGKIGFAQDTFGVRTSDPREENVQIVANYTNAESINISGWTLQSALTSASVQIPLAASVFISGGANTVGSVSLDPGALAIVTTAPSPVGLSFRENMCAGYLQQFQPFEPPLLDECPAPSGILPLTERNLQQYGEGCFDAIANIPSCRFPQALPQNTTPACRAFLADALSYNGCVRDNRFRSEFHKNSWRLFLGSTQELWRNSHDAIRLLDNEGRTVSVFVY